jgi:hypothetical protein
MIASVVLQMMIASYITVGVEEHIIPLFIDNMLVVLLGAFLVNIIVFAGLLTESE